MNETTIKALNKATENFIKSNNGVIAEKITDGINESDNESIVYAKMLNNCISLSTSLAVQAVMSILEDANVICLDERQIAKLYLKQLSSDANN